MRCIKIKNGEVLAENNKPSLLFKELKKLTGDHGIAMKYYEQTQQDAFIIKHQYLPKDANNEPLLPKNLSYKTWPANIEDIFYSLRGNSVTLSNDIYFQLGNKTQSENVTIVPNPISAVKSYGGVAAYRDSSNSNHWGNPFTHLDESQTKFKLVKVGSVKEAVQSFIDWLTTDKYSNVEPERRKNLIEQLKSGNLKNQPIFYYKELKEPSHATALDYLINKYDWNQPTETKQEEIDFVFEQFQELSKIGTKQQYSQYLDTIFPDSKVKDIVYHGVIKGRPAFRDIMENGFKQTQNNWGTKKNIDKKYKGIFFSDYNTAFGYGAEQEENRNITDPNHPDYIFLHINVIPAILNIEYLDSSQGSNSGIAERFYEANKDKKNIGMYGLEEGEGVHFNHVVFEPEQIHILSSKKDLEMFRNFINFTKSEYAKYGDIQQFKDYIMSKNFAAIEEFLVVNNKIDRKC